jgi:hypothetical protein
MSDEPILREKAREAIESGRLPAARPRRTVYGHSAGAICTVCGYAVRRGEMHYELEFQASPPTEGKSLRDTLQRFNAWPEVRRSILHERCFAAWEFECSQVGPADRRPST